MRADQHAAGAEEAVVRQPLHDAEMPAQDRRIPQRLGRARKQLQRRPRATGGMRLDQRQHARILRPDVKLPLPSRHLRVLEVRSEEHTSELQSLMRTSYAVFCLKKKQTNSPTKQ